MYRVQGRIGNSLCKDETKYPIYISAKSQLTELFVYSIHLTMPHAGPSTVLNQTRLSYRIPQGRRRINHIIHKFCLPCRKLTVQSFSKPPMPMLPPKRVQIHSVFTNTGVDYFGSLLTKGNSKIWVSLFTCLSTRAIHLKVTENLLAEALIDAFQKFIARRGKPQSLISDNEKQFILTKKLVDPISSIKITMFID